MKNKLLIGLLVCAMTTTLCLGIAACGGNGMSDADKAQTAINTLNSLYLDGEGNVKNYETPANYLVLSQVKVEEETLPVTWTATVTSPAEGYEQNIKIGTEKDAQARYTVEITRATVDIEYKLTASVTAGSETRTADYTHKIPKKSSEDAITATLSFETTASRVSQTAAQQVWQSNGITFTNDKGTGNDIVDSKNPVRLYAGSIVTIEFNNMTRLDFHCDTPNFENTYTTDLKSSIEAAYPTATVTIDEDTRIVTAVLADPVNSITFTMKKQVRLDSIDVEGLAGELSDAQKVAAAKASLSLAQTLFFEQNTIDLLAENNGAAIAWSIKETTTDASIVEGKQLKVTTLPAAETKLTLVATITSGEESDTAEFQITLKPQPTLQHAGTQADPYSTADVITISKLLVSGSYYMKDGANAKIYVKGYIIAGTWSKTYNNFDGMYIADSIASTSSSTDALQIFGLKTDSKFITEQTLPVGATVTILGGIQNYSGKTEIALQPQTVALEDNRTLEQQLQAALGTLADITITETGDVSLAASFGDVTFTWALKDDEKLPQGTAFADGKLTVTTLPAADTTVKFVVTAKLTGATDQTKEISVTIKAKSDEPQPGDALELTRETLFAGITGTGYNPYNGAHTVGGAKVTTSNVLGTDNYYDGSSNLPFGFTVMQFKKTDGTLSLKGTFTKIVVVIATSYDYDSADKLTITAGSTTLTAGNHTEADANFSQGGKAWKFYTIEYDVTTTGEQTITFKGATHAVYVKSITLTGTASQGGTVDPEPELPDPAKGTEIVADGATVFDFSDVAVAGANDYKAMTNEAVLAAFKNASEAGLTSVEFDYIYAGNNGTSGPAAYQGKGGFLRLGKSKTNGTFTLNFSKDINKIQILCLGWSDSDTIAIDGFNPATIGNTTPVAFTFTLTKAVKSFTITSADRAFIFKIAVTFADGSTVEPEHSHVFGNYTCDPAAMTHSRTCTADNCTLENSTETGACAPENNVCATCNHTYTAAEVNAAALKLSGSAKLAGTYTFTGVVQASNYAVTENYITFDFKINDSELVFQAYQVVGDDFNTVKVGDTVTIQGQITEYNSTVEFAKGSTITAIEHSAVHICSHVCTLCGKCADDACEDPACADKCECNFGTKESPLSVADLLALITNKLADGKFTSKLVYVKGIATNTPTGAGYWSNLTIKDESTSDQILIFTVNPRDKDTIAAPVQNDKLLICGYVKNYQGTMEFASNNGVYVYIEENVRGESDITVTNDGGAVVADLPAKATNGTEVTFTVTANSGKKIVSVKANDQTLSAQEENTYKLTIAGNMTIAITTADENETVDTEVASLTFGAEIGAGDGKANGYSTTWEATRDSVAWEIANFNNNSDKNGMYKNSWTYIKTGQKGTSSNPDRPVTAMISTKTAIAQTVTKVVVNIKENTTDIPSKINSFKLLISSTDDFAETKEVTLTMQGGDNTFIIPADAQGANLYYRIVFDCATGSANGFVEVNSVTYLGH